MQPPIFSDSADSDFDFRQRSVRGSAFALIGQVFKFGLQLAATMVLARLLTPEDYGLFSIGMAVVVFANLFKDLGLPMAMVQSAEINHEQVTTLFWINVALGCILALATVIAAPLIGWVYREPRLVAMLWAMASLYIVNGLIGQPVAVLQRQMRFVTLAAIDGTAVLIGVIVALVAAWNGASYWALVDMQLATIAAHALGVWTVSQWRPGLPRRHSGVRRMLGFGRNVTGASITSYLARNLDNLLIGWYWGARELGLYDKAYQVLLLPFLQISTPIVGVALPVLSRLQSDPRRYRNYYARIILVVAGLGMAMATFLFVAADKAIIVILGSQWQASVPIFRALAPAAFVDTFFVGIKWILLSLGQSARLLRAMVVISSITIAGLVIGLGWGAVGVAITFSVCRLAVLLPMLVFACHASPLRWTDVLAMIWRPAVAAISAAMGLALAMQWLSLAPNLLADLLLNGGMYVLFYLLVWFALPGGRQIAWEMALLLPHFGLRQNNGEDA